MLELMVDANTNATPANSAGTYTYVIAEFVVSNVSVPLGIHVPTMATDVIGRALGLKPLRLLDRAVDGKRSIRAMLGASMSHLKTVVPSF